MNKKMTWIAVILLLAAGRTFSGAITSKFESQTGGTAGSGHLNQMPFTWKTSAAAEKTMDTSLRVNNFAGNEAEFLFGSGSAAIETMILRNVNPSSQYVFEFYDADGALIPPANATVSSPDGVTGTPVSTEGGVLAVAGSSAGSGIKNYRIDIDLMPALQNVKRIVIRVKKEAGLLDLSFKGTPSR